MAPNTTQSQEPFHTVNETASPCTIIVIGAGIIGLTTAITLRKLGHEVHVLAEETPSTILDREKTELKNSPLGTYASSGSAGFWWPFSIRGDHVEYWATMTYKKLHEEAEMEGRGVYLHDGYLLYATKKPEQLPWYSELTRLSVRTPHDDSRIPRQYDCALHFYTAIAVMNEYLPYLERTAKTDLGISIALSSSIPHASSDSKLSYSDVCAYAKSTFPEADSEKRLAIINCCGIGARTFSGDNSVTPGRGVTVRVKRPPGLDYFITEEDTDGILSRDGLLVYAHPRGEEYTLGGTIYKGQWEEEATQEEIQGVRDRCNMIIPGIGDAEVTAHWTGLRPLRNEGVRLEVEKNGNEDDESIPMISNYGHGGGGVTVSWGCAAQVGAIIESLFVS